LLKQKVILQFPNIFLLKLWIFFINVSGSYLFIFQALTNFRLDPHERPNVLQLIRHKFVSGVENIYHSPTTRTEEKPLQKKNTLENGLRSSQVKPIM